MSDNNVLSFFVPGVPQGKGRPRVCVKGGRAWAYTPKKTRTYEDEIRAAFVADYPNHVPIEGPITLCVITTFPWPKSTPKSKRDYRKITKPDCDNLAKVSDALNGVAWTDDARIWQMYVIKTYSEPPHGLLIKIIIDK